MLLALKTIGIISLFISKSLSASFDADAFVKKSQDLRESALKDTKDFLEPELKNKGPEAQNIKGSLTTLNKDPWRPLRKNYDELLKKTFTLEDATKSKVEFYIFISFSLSRKTLHSLLKASQTYGATLVLRGLKEGSFKKTVSALMELYKDTKGRVVLDPSLFKKFNINSVPSFLVTQGSRSKEKGREASLRLSGNVSPRFALTEFQKHAPFEDFAKELLQ